MLAQERHELMQRIEDLKKEVETLRSQLNAQDPEGLFSERQRVGREVRDLIKQVEAERKDRDSMVGEIKALKEQRDAFHETVKKKAEENTLASDQKKGNEKKNSSQTVPALDPESVRREMRRLEYKIETDALPFDKELVLMKKIKELKKIFVASQKVFAEREKERVAYRELNSARAQADSLHVQVQQKASLSQKKHEHVIEVSKKIDELRAKEDAITKTINEKSAALEPISVQLEEKLTLLAELSAKAQAERKVQRSSREQEKQRSLSEKQAQVQEKIKKGGKLTTEDLLVLQTLPEEADIKS